MKIGTKMGGYQLLGLIARGGMGAVYEALEVQLERKVALKVIAPPNPDDHDADELVQRFMQEARTLARVNHPNVITIYAIDASEGVPFITMELVAGISFKELLHVSFLSADLAAPMFIQMLEGLHCLHENRIVHRDLKPHNIMVRVDGQIKILDFGIAKPVDQGNFTSVGIVVGSLAYMAPEVKMGVAATERSDLWNIGAIFYECLTGKALPKAMADNPNSKDIPYAANSPVPMEMRSIIAKLCAYKPIDRYENAMQAVEELRRYQRSRPPLSADALATFGRKVEEIMAKRKGDSKDMPAADVKPVQANTFSSERAEFTPPFRREREYSRPAPRRKKFQLSQRWLIGGGVTLAIAALIAVKQKPADEPITITAAPVPEEAPAKPVRAAPAKEKVKKASPGPVALDEPAADSTIWLEPSAIPTLTWSREVKAGDYEIQIATDRAFRNTILREPVSGKSYRPARILPEDKYFWRLVPSDSATPISGPSRFTLAHITPVELISPPAQNSVEIGAKEKAGSVDFAWKCKPGTDSYQIQIAAGAKFAGSLRESSTNSCYWREANLPPGTYRWRVRGKEGSKLARVWSEGREFSIKRGVSASKPAAPALAKPVLGESTRTLVLNFKTTPRDLASLSGAVENLPEMKWQPVKSAKQYLLQISEDKDFAQMHSEHTLTDTKFTWKSAAPGIFFWRVAAVSSSALQGPFSDGARLRIFLPVPKLKPRYKFEAPVDGDHQIISWPAVPLADKYIVQLGTNRQLAQADEQVIAQSKFPLPNKHGNYYARVAAANGNGVALSQFSPTTAIALEPVAVLDTPELQLPTAGAAAVARSGRLSITFQWSKIPKAETYVLEISADDDFSKPIERMTTRESSMLLKKVELRGRVYWRVRAENREGTSTWSDPSYFEVRN